MAGMRFSVVITLIDLVLTGAEYEDRVGWATHDTPAVAVLGFLAALIELAVPLDLVLAISGSVWAVTVVATVVAFLAWLGQAARNTDRGNGRPRRPAGRVSAGRFVAVADVVLPYRVLREVNAASAEPQAPVGRWWAALLVTVPLVAAGAVWRVAIVGGHIDGEQMRDSRVLAYLLWAAGAAALWYTATLGRKVVRRITEAQAARAQVS